MRYHLRLIPLLLFFYLFSAFVSTSHIHYDETAHEDCNVCLVVKNLHSGDITPSVTLDSIVYTYNRAILPSVVRYTQYKNLKFIHSQAPPLFS